MGGHVAKALASEVDFVILDRTFSSISMIPRFSYSPIIQRIFDLCLDNYQINCSSLLETEAKKIIIYDPKTDEVIPYLTSVTFGVSVEMANLFFNKANKIDLEKTGDLSKSRSKRISNAAIQQSYFSRQTKLLNYYKLLLNQRDAAVLFHALKRIVATCIARAQSKDDKGDTKPQKVAEFDLDRLTSETDAEILDQDTLTSIHEGRMPDPHFKKLTDPGFDYSNMLEDLIEKKRCFEVIDKIFTALSFIETAGLQLPMIFVMREDHQEVVFQVNTDNQSFIVSLMFWGSNLPVSAFLQSPSSSFDVLIPFKLAIVDLTHQAKLEDSINSLMEQSVVLDQLRRDNPNSSSFFQMVAES